MSRAAAMRWFAQRVGQEVHTLQVHPSGRTWVPGPRTVEPYGKVGFVLNDSHVRFTKGHEVHEVTDDRVVVEWQDEDGVRIHVTTYSDEEITRCTT